MPAVIRLVKSVWQLFIHQSSGVTGGAKTNPIVEVWGHNFTRPNFVLPDIRSGFFPELPVLCGFLREVKHRQKVLWHQIVKSRIAPMSFPLGMFCSPVVLWNKKAIGENSCIRQLVYLPFNLRLFAFTNSNFAQTLNFHNSCRCSSILRPVSRAHPSQCQDRLLLLL